MPTLEALGKLVKQNYPQYSDMGDLELAQKIKAKYPNAYPEYSQSTQDFQDAQVSAQNEAKKSTVSRFFRALPGAALDVGVGGIAQFGASALEAPKTLVTGKASDRSYKLPGLSPFKSVQSEAQQAVQEGSQTAGQAILTKGLKTLGEGAQTLGATKSLLGDVNLGTTKQPFSRFDVQQGVIPKAITKLNDLSKEKNILKLLEPSLNKGAREDLAKAGKLSTPGVQGKVTTQLDKNMVDVARPYIRSAKNEVTAINNLRGGIEKEADNLIGTVKGGTWSNNNLKGATNNVKVPLGVKGVSEPQVQAIKDYVSSLGQGSTKDAKGALQVAKQFRMTINDEFGENIWYKDTPIAKYVRSMNRALNNFAGTTLPDSSVLHSSLQKQSLLYDAIDNIAPKIPQIGEPTTAIGKGFSTLKRSVITGAGTVAGGGGVYELYRKIFRK